MYTLNLTEQEVNTIGKGLSHLPYGEVAVLVQDIMKQLQPQMAKEEVKEETVEG